PRPVRQQLTARTSVSGAERTSRDDRTEIVEVRGVGLRVTVRPAVNGSGSPPLLLCNGIGAPVELWGPFRDALDDRTTIAFDAPGVGASAIPPFPPTVTGLAGLVTGVLDH